MSTFDDHASFGTAKMEDIGGFKLPKQQAEESTLSYDNKGNVDDMGVFPSK